ncbi:MAG TPA: hypothetical protein P5056_03250 [Candidatus Paceibacterota bacterium]|nr:hypothetical protein [Candidatus Paceibacterota bacterium]
MSNKNYRILIIVISLVIVLAAVLTVFFLSRQAEVPVPAAVIPTTTTTTQNNGVSFPTSGEVTSPATKNEPVSQNVIPEINPSNQAVTQVETFVGEIKNTADIATGGMTFIEKARNGIATTFIRYIEKGTGHIQEIAFDENIPTKVTNTTMTGIFSSVWNKDGSAVIIKRLDSVNNNIQTIYGTIEDGTGDMTIPEGAVGSLRGTILPANTIDVAVSPLNNKLFYLIKNGDSVIGSVSDFGGTNPFDKKINIWSSPISEWQVSWPKQDQIMLLTKPAYNVSGLLYSSAVPKNNKFEKVLGDITGLTALTSVSGKKIIYSETTGSGFMTYILDKTTGGTKVFPVKTLPEKCVWSRTNENVVYCGVPKVIVGSKYPDAWYKGNISFNDDIYRIDLDVNSGRKIESKGQPDDLDATELKLSPNEDYLSFINKKDSKIWTLRLK